MKIKLDKKTECAINQNYSIDTSVFELIEERNRIAGNSIASVKDILESSPKAITEPETTDSTLKNIQNRIQYELNLKESEFNSVKQSLSVLDVSIDKIDELVQKIDEKINQLITEINYNIDSVKNAYDERINVGCRTALKWRFLGYSKGFNPSKSSDTEFSNFVAVKDPQFEVRRNYYGLKYYQKPSNRDYGFSLIKEFTGTAQINSQVLSVVGVGGTSNIKIGDEVTDKINGTSSFYMNELPKVVGFGTTTSIGIHTSLYGTISTGSSVLPITGLGNTDNISIGNYIISTALNQNTKVIGFGSTSVNITYYDVGTASTVTESIIVSSILMNKVAISSAPEQLIGFGSESIVPSLLLDKSSLATIENSTFNVIRKIEDAELDFDYTKNPLDPVTISIIEDNSLGIGNKIKLVNDGNLPGPFTWREVLGDSEPPCGNSYASYYTGDNQWPYDTGLPLALTEVPGYAVEGVIYKLTNVGIGYSPGYTSNPPISGLDCSSYNSEINKAENKLTKITQTNLPEINKLIAYSSALRNIRNRYELQAWSYLQASSYLNQELNEFNVKLEDLNNLDENIFQ